MKIHKKINEILGLDQFSTRAYLYFLSALYFVGDGIGYSPDPRIPGFLSTLVFVLFALVIACSLHGLALLLLKGSPYQRLLDLIPPGLFIYALDQWIFSIQTDGMFSDGFAYGFIAVIFILELFFIRILRAKSLKGWKIPLVVLILILQGGFFSFFLLPGFPPVGTKDIRFKETKLPKAQAREVSYGEKSPRVNLSAYASYSGWNKKFRDWYWGYSLNQVPLAGKVYLPENKNAPVLFFLHGNHQMTIPSHLGYDYLGRYLASQGIATVSVDENCLNGFLGKGVGNENDARAILLLENIRYLFQENKNPQSPFYQSFQEEEVYLGGHSRGGEAAHLAADFSRQEVYPDNGTTSLNYPLSVKGVITLSPTSAQYTPAGHFSALKDVNYLTIHGSHDCDVSDFMGDDGYNHVALKDPDKKKMALYVGYMNHARSNEKWRRDREAPLGFLYNEKDLLSRSQQETIVAQSILGFLKDSIEGKEDFFQDPREVLPDSIYYIKKQRGGEETLTDFEEDYQLLTNSLGGRNQVEGARTFREIELDHTGGGPFVQKHGLKLGFNRRASYQMTIPANDFTGVQGVAIDGMNLELDPVNLEVEIQDQEGRSLVLGQDPQNLQGQISLALTKLQVFTKDEESKSAFETLYFPLSKENRDSIDLGKITSVKVTFSGEMGGTVLVSEIRKF